MFELTTERMVLRPVCAEDAAAVHDAMARDFDVVRHTGTWPWPASLEATRSKCAAGFGPQGGWMVARRAEEVIGMVGLGADGDFGYMLARSAWGQGYATEMAMALLQHLQDQAQFEQLKACVFADNPASARVLEKLGFVEGAACKGHCAARHGEFPIRTFTRSVQQG